MVHDSFQKHNFLGDYLRAFLHTDEPNFHKKRNKELYAKYGKEIKKLTGPKPITALLIFAIVTTHYLSAYAFSSFNWFALVLLSYFVGAFFSHALYVMIHECTHNLVFKKTFWNKVMHIACDIPLFFPSSIGFRHYHMSHHRFLGQYEKDPDIPHNWEAKFIANSSIKKFFWMLFFMFSQTFRSIRIQGVKVFDRWLILNILVVVVMNIIAWNIGGAKMLTYLALSTFFALGLHPLGGRWIQEHFLVDKNQETYSYYGPLNKVAFNVGYHVEHHDIMTISWINLPKLKALAPEYYNSLISFSSWPRVLQDFIFNKARSPFTRTIRKSSPSAL